MALNKSPTIPLGPVKAPVDPKPQPFIHNGKFLVSRVVIRAEKTYTGLERERIFPVDVVLEELSKSKIAEEPCPRFKEWTSDLRGLEFTLAVTVPPVTPNIVFGPFNYEREPIQMVRCITANLLSDKYGITCQPGEVYCPAQYWWLLVTAPHAHSLVQPNSLRSCLESLRTVVTEELILCFHIVDLYRGKLRFRWWLELIITLFASFPRIRLLDDWTHSFTEPVTIHTALGTLDSWSTANVDNQSLSRSVWQDLSAIRGQNHMDPADEKGPGRQIVFPGALRPNLVDYIVYDQTDFLQVQGHVAICCPADLNTNSAALRYILRECGSDKIFQLRPTVGEVLTIPSSLSFMDYQVIHLMITRPSQRSPQITDDFFLCLEHLKASLLSSETPDIHFPIVDPERPLRSLDNFYHSVMDVFAGTDITAFLHDRVYVSIASIEQFPGIT